MDMNVYRLWNLLLRSLLRLLSIITVTFLISSLATAPSMGGEQKKKIVHAHRGACGYLPEHTLPSYALAHGMGADYIEPDLVLTRDEVFICVHDIYLDDATNVRERYPERARSDGHWYAIDFTLAEIKTLTVNERSEDGEMAVFPGRFPFRKSRFEIATFEEMIELVQGLNRSRGLNTGIIPELKHPAFHAREGKPMEEAFLKIIRKYGYESESEKIYIQCFEAETLKKLRSLGCGKPLVQLVEEPGSEDRYGAPFAEELTQKSLAGIASYARVVSPHKSRIEKNPQIVRWAHDAGLEVCPYTMRKDTLPEKYSSPGEELFQFYCIYDVDAVFTDFPDIAVKLLEALKMR